MSCYGRNLVASRVRPLERRGLYKSRQQTGPHRVPVPWRSVAGVAKYLVDMQASFGCVSNHVRTQVG